MKEWCKPYHLWTACFLYELGLVNKWDSKLLHNKWYSPTCELKNLGSVEMHWETHRTRKTNTLPNSAYYILWQNTTNENFSESPPEVTYSTILCLFPQKWVPLCSMLLTLRKLHMIAAFHGTMGSLWVYSGSLLYNGNQRELHKQKHS